MRDSMESIMKIKSVDTELGLKNCSQSQEIYCTVLSSTCDEGAEKARLLMEAFHNKNFKVYGVVAHGIKGAALTIGAVSLSETARKHELAAKEGDFDYIEKHVEELLLEYMNLIEALSFIM